MLIVLVLLAAVGLLAALVFAAVRVGREAAELQRVQRVSANARLEALVELDQARARLDGGRRADAASGERRSRPGSARWAGRGRRWRLLFEAAGEALRQVRVPR